MQFKTAVQMGMGAIGFGIWSYATYNDPSLQADYLTFVKGIVIGVAALALRDMKPSPESQVKDEPKQEEIKQ